MLLNRLMGLGQPRQRLEGVVKVRSRLRIDRAVEPSQARLARVEYDLVPHLTAERMMGEPFDVLSHAAGMEPLQDLDDLGMEDTAPLLEQTPVGDLVREGVLESVCRSGNRRVSYRNSAT